jgi:hypothetical protein
LKVLVCNEDIILAFGPTMMILVSSNYNIMALLEITMKFLVER